MSKLVDKERLAKLAKALDGRMKDAVTAEETRAKAAEQTAQSKADQAAADILAINNAETGILKQAKDYADGKDAAINAKVDFTVYDAKIKLIDEKDGAQDADILALQGKVTTLEEKMGEGDLAGVDKKINDAVAELETADTNLGNRIAVFEADGEKDVAALINRATALEEKVGHDAEGEEVASGLFLEVDQAMAKANEVDQAVATEKGRAEGQEAAIRQEMANEATRVNQKIADDIAAESVLRVAEEQRIEGLVSAEAQRAAGKEETLQGEIDAAEGRLDALEARFTGDESIDAKIAKVAQDVADEKERAEGVEADLNEAIEAEASRAASKEAELLQAINNEASRADAAEKVNAQAIADMKDATKEDSLAKQIADEVARATGVENGLETRVKANEDKLAGLTNATVKAEIEAAQAAAEKHADDAITALVDSAPEAMDTLKELAQAIADHQDVYEEYVATVSSNIADAKQAAIDAAAADAKSKDDALEAKLNQKIADDVKAEADRAKAEEADIRADFATADTALHTTISAEIDADVKAEADRAKGIEQGLQAAIDVLNGADNEAGSVAKAVKDAVGVESQRALAQEAAIRSEFAAADTTLENRIVTLEGLVVGGEGEGLEAVIADVAQNKSDIKDLKEEDLRLAGEIDLKVAKSDYEAKVEVLEGADERIEGIAQGAQDAVDVVEGRMDIAEGEIDALQAFMNGHDHSVMEQGITDAKKAAADAQTDIDVLNGAADVEGSVAKSIADALEPYSTTEEMKVILANVVNSLALTMEDNKMVLRLGGAEGIAIHETSLDMATDADIDDIINGLDA